MREGKDDDVKKGIINEKEEGDISKGKDEAEDMFYTMSKISKMTMPSYCKTKIDPNIKKPGPSLQAIEKFNIGRESSKLAVNSDSRSK